MKTVPELEAEIRVLRELVASQGKTIEMLLKQPAPAPVVSAPVYVPVPCGLPHYPAPPAINPYPWPGTIITYAVPPYAAGAAGCAGGIPVEWVVSHNALGTGSS